MLDELDAMRPYEVTHQLEFRRSCELDECLEDIDERYRRGRLTAEQRGRLRHVLLEGVGH